MDKSLLLNLNRIPNTRGEAQGFDKWKDARKKRYSTFFEKWDSGAILRFIPERIEKKEKDHNYSQQIFKNIFNGKKESRSKWKQGKVIRIHILTRIYDHGIRYVNHRDDFRETLKF